MVTRIRHVTWRCEKCKREWPTPKIARQCESYPAPALQKGDVVLWIGRRDDVYPVQAMVYDWVEAIRPDQMLTEPGHSVTYQLHKEISFRDDELSDARHGYVNIAHRRLGLSPIHSDRLEVSLSEIGGSIQPVIQLLTRAGLPIQPRMAALYQRLQYLAYSNTWSGTHTIAGHKLTPELAHVFEFVSRAITNEECLAFIGGWEEYPHNRKAKSQLGNALEHNHFHDWCGLVDFDLDNAFRLLADQGDAELILRVRRYREALLKSEALFAWSSGLKALFPLDTSKAIGKWPGDILAWVKANNIRGTGETRLRRVYETALKLANEQPAEARKTMKRLTLFDDRTVIAVMSGKGGVGKSTVAALLARALVLAGKKVCVYDVDFYGPSQPALFPVTDRRLKTHERKIVPHIVDGVEVVSLGHLLGEGEALEWTGPHLRAAIHTLGAHLETDAEIIILDMPPGTGDTSRAILDLFPDAWYLTVATAGQVALDAIARSIEVLDGNSRSRILGVIENLAYVETPNSQRVHLWGKETDVPDFARRHSLSHLGSLPMVNGEHDDRIEILTRTVVPLVLDCLAGKHHYQQVDPSTIVDAAEQLIAAHRAEQSAAETDQAIRNSGLNRDPDSLIICIQHVYTPAGIASSLAAPIVNAGGNPDDQRYRHTLRREFQRVTTALGDAVKADTEDRAQAADRYGHWWQSLVRPRSAKMRPGPKK